MFVCWVKVCNAPGAQESPAASPDDEAWSGDLLHGVSGRCGGKLNKLAWGGYFTNTSSLGKILIQTIASVSMLIPPLDTLYCALLGYF